MCYRVTRATVVMVHDHFPLPTSETHDQLYYHHQEDLAFIRVAMR